MAKPEGEPNYLKDIHVIKNKKGGDDYVYAWRGGGPRIYGEVGSEQSISEWRAAISIRRLGVEGTLKGLIDDYRKSQKWVGQGRKALAPKTRENYDYWFKRIEAKFGDMALIIFDEPEIRDEIIKWRDTYAAKPRTADMGVAAFSVLLAYGIQRRKIAQNFAKGIEKLYESERSHLIWRAPDMAILQKAATPAVWRAAKLASLTGLRQGDLLKLRWDQLDDDAADVDTSKSRGRTRAMVIRHPALDTFLGALQADRAKALGDHERDPENHPEPAPTVLITDRLSRSWRGGFGASWRATKKRGAKLIKDPAHRAWFEGLHFHDLRGTAATELSAAGLSNAQIAMFLGWKEEAVTELLKRYVDRKTVARKVRTQLQNAFQEADSGEIPEPANSDQNEGSVKTSVKNDDQAASAGVGP